LKLDDDPSLPQLLGQSLVAPFERLDLASGTAIGICFRPSLAGEPSHPIGLSLPSPRDQMRGIQPFTPQQSSDLT
jgi:hypothetical protein